MDSRFTKKTINVNDTLIVCKNLNFDKSPSSVALFVIGIMA